MRKSTLIATGAALALALVLPGAASAQTSPPLVWTAPILVEHAPFLYGGLATSVSCPSVSLCVVGDDNGNIITSTDPSTNPATWTAASIPHARSFAFLSCHTTTFCLALSQKPKVGGPSQIFTSTNPTGGGGAWVAGAAHPPIGGISCPSSTLCVIGGTGQIAISTNPAAGVTTTWKVTARWPALSSISITAMSCPNVRFCIGVDEAGDVYSSANPTGGKQAWKVTRVDKSAGLSELTCHSASFCASLDTLGRLAYSRNPGGGASAWHLTTAPDHAVGLICLSARFCIARDSGRQYGAQSSVMTTTNPRGGSPSWQITRATPFPDPMIGLACATSTLCGAVDATGNAATSTDPGGGPLAWNLVRVSGSSPLKSIDCPAAALCLAGDYVGNVITSTAPGGSAADWHLTHLEGTSRKGIPTGVDVSAISCPATNLCLAVVGGTLFWSTNPTGGATAWSTADVDATGTIIAISCPTTSLCVAADSNGNILTSTNPTGGASAWQVGNVSVPDDLIFVTCPTASLCLASGFRSVIFTSTDPAGGASTWKISAGLINNDGIGPMTCPTATLCVAIGMHDFGFGPEPAVFSSHTPTGGPADWRIVGVGPADRDYDEVGGTISCASASFCLAEFFFANHLRDVLASADPASSKTSAWVDTGITADAVSCPTTSMCVVGNDSGQVQIGTTPLATKTMITSVTKSPVVGQPITVGVQVAAATTGPSVPTPGGTVAVTTSHATCTAHLSGSAGVATGQCTITERAPGAYDVNASYGAQSPYGGSQATSVPVTVAPARSATTLKLSAKRVTYGHEQGERLTVTVHPQFSGAPAGTVVIKVKAKTICTLRLSGGTATCRLTRKRLRPGRYQLTARYAGNNAFIKSTSAAELLKVLR